MERKTDSVKDRGDWEVLLSAGLDSTTDVAEADCYSKCCPWLDH
jgi:hypothetical protein